jgi:hypothetical protein
MLGLRLSKIVPDDFVEGGSIPHSTQKSRHGGGSFVSGGGGGIFAPSMALTLRATGFADVHFGILPS